MKKLIIKNIVYSVIWLFAWSAMASSQAPSYAEFASQFDEKLTEQGVVGAQLVMFDDKHILFKQNFGYRDKSLNLPVERDRKSTRLNSSH